MKSQKRAGQIQWHSGHMKGSRLSREWLKLWSLEFLHVRNELKGMEEGREVESHDRNH